MADTTPALYELVFSGQAVPGADPQKVRNNAAKLFRAGPEQLEKLFSGATVVLKNKLDQATAESYQQKLKSAGLICTLRAMGQPAAATQAAPAPQPSEPAEPTSTASPTSTPAPAPAPKPAEEPVQSGWSVAPTGSDVNPHEPEPVPPMPDTSHLTLKEQKGYLFDQDDTPPPPAPDTSHLTLE
ncbi:hypothetical protein PAHA111176_13765 [Parendozoicomonas haliclonae]|uniref:hypothetical protein n=1 Tax=Parendozoicomonas haliclonae TaxID=1960125 RepID=UPI0039F0518E